MPKKSNTKRTDGRYSVQVFIGRVDGKRKYKTVYGKTQKEANEKAEEIKLSLRKGIDILSQSDSFETCAKRWLSEKKVEVSEDQYNVLVPRAQIWCEALEGIPLRQIKPYMLQEILNNIAKNNPYTKKPSAKRTITRYAHTVSAIFEFAVENRIIEFNPALKLKIPQNAAQHERRALSPLERERVIEFQHRGRDAAMLLMFSGLRRGEATALRWNDIDFENNTITVSKSYNFKQNKIKTPKNGKKRVVTVPQILINHLKTMKRYSPYVLVTAREKKMLTQTAWRSLFDSYMKDMNLKYGNFEVVPKKCSPIKPPMLIQEFTPHDLRHTFCTMMYEAGIDVLTAKEQMGHSDVKTTLGIYTHLDAEKKKRDMSKLDEFISCSQQDASQMQVKSS